MMVMTGKAGVVIEQDQQGCCAWLTAAGVEAMVSKAGFIEEASIQAMPPE